MQEFLADIWAVPPTLLALILLYLVQHHTHRRLKLCCAFMALWYFLGLLISWLVQDNIAPEPHWLLYVVLEVVFIAILRYLHGPWTTTVLQVLAVILGGAMASLPKTHGLVVFVDTYYVYVWLALNVSITLTLVPGTRQPDPIPA